MNTLRDPRDEPLQAAGQASVGRFETVLDQYLSFRGDPSAGLKALLADDPDFPLARCLKTAFLLYQHQRALRPKVGAELTRLESLTLNPREQAHAEALAAWRDGRLNAAAERWERLLLDHPRDLLALKLSQDLRFFLGQGPQIRDGVARLLPAWDSSLPGYGYLLGMYAFGLQECADYQHAEGSGRQALALNRYDAWAVHAVAHVMEMQGRREEGIAWLAERRSDWAEDNFFAVHQWWHLSLFYFDLCRHDELLAVYDREIGPKAATLLLHQVDASAALWRLHLAGVDSGERAAALAELWQPQADNAVNVFNDSHAMMCFALTGDRASAARLLAAQQTPADDDDVDHATALIVYRAGLAVNQALWAFGREDYRRAVELLLPIRYALPLLGGSHAQRDVYLLTLLEALLRSGQQRVGAALLAERAALRPHSPYDQCMLERAKK